MLRGLLLAVMLVWVADGIAHAQCVPLERSPRTETFSTIKIIQGQGPAGSELQLEEQGERVVATLKDYRGSPVPIETKLEGFLEESKPSGAAPTTCRVRLSGKDKKGPVEIEGEITPAYFHGGVTRRVGKEVVSYRLSLRRQVPRDNYGVGALYVPEQIFGNTTTGGYRCGRV